MPQIRKHPPRRRLLIWGSASLTFPDDRIAVDPNGETMQDQNSIDHIHNVHVILSYISQYVTLYPGDIIFTGTPDATAAMKPGDVVAIEVEGVGILRNRVFATNE
ncbi:MAG: fumarylacetoacetate hydrolase family protein [Gammaproteobacteria bacterium]|nr:fumarylacetoacetate hydrolase family protein [Gammaproteobacteria bacterium]